MADLSINTSNKRVRDDSDDSQSDSPETKRIRENLLDDLLDDSDFDKNLDLVSVMKSFEEEITTTLPSSNVISKTQQPELGFLLEASDDELGLPPTFSSSSSADEETDLLSSVPSDTVGSSSLDQIWGFEDEIPSYEFGIITGGDDEKQNNINGGFDEFVTVDGLFEYSDILYELSDFSDYSWRTDSLPAL